MIIFRVSAYQTKFTNKKPGGNNKSVPARFKSKRKVRNHGRQEPIPVGDRTRLALIKKVLRDYTIRDSSNAS